MSLDRSPSIPPSENVLRVVELAAHRVEVAARHLRELAGDVRRSPTGLGAPELEGAVTSLIDALVKASGACSPLLPPPPPPEPELVSSPAERDAGWSAAFEAFGREVNAAWLDEVLAGRRRLPVVAEPELTIFLRVECDGSMHNASLDPDGTLASHARDVAEHFTPELWDPCEEVPHDRAEWLALLDDWYDRPEVLRVTGPRSAIRMLGWGCASCGFREWVSGLTHPT